MAKKKVLTFLIFLFSFFIINNLYAKKIEILYKVENYPITNKDIEKEINYLIMLNQELKKIDNKELFIINFL